ncbi:MULTISPECIES: type III secretion protein HrpB7 [Ralstonia solanacearum species complex]|uniref:Hrpd protein n=3 Tax=Ralstonia solanacearum TaxID=305 RepID=A0A7U7JE39_RALSL|nr:type III secretion protein HrpB7 [Ralstonia solanacearum]ALF90363.1 Bacterial type III secretion protein (HrpB7) [Ralstonia solanacearum]ATI29830.1 type III secretion protein HrpB7 [Ralstonia solanacearum]EAP72642.1 HrpD [Ralstonia solanacearum UW551]KEI33420.1 type III secretion protein [Ralstonia solanacearum]KFX28035.1 type III secretion protein [Ralstonia solanacearum]
MKRKRRSSVWRALIEAKTRERRRVEADIEAAQAALAEAQAAVEARQDAQRQAEQRLDAHLRSMDDLTTGSALTAQAYLQYDAYRVVLDDAVAQAEQAVAAAQGVVAEREAALQAQRRRLARLDAMLERCRETADRLDRKEDTELELATEEEAIEAIVARARYTTTH